jgi:penicillin-binding protein 1C
VRAKTASLRRPLALVGALAALALLLRLLPADPLSARVPRSTAIYAAGGELLRLTLAQDQQYRLWTPLAQMSPRLAEAVLLYEDRRFRWHPGVDPAALLGSAWSTYVLGTRRGGSTVTMQLARRLYGIDSRSIGGKIEQIARALWLEARHSKREILEAYLNLAPYGGNVEGAGAASLVHFGKPVRELTLAEALTLAVVPQDPNRRIASAAGGELAQARERLWRRWLDAHPEDVRYASDMALVAPGRTAAQLPFRAPHLTDLLLRERGAAGAPIRSSIDLRLQTTLERVLRQHVAREREFGIRNAAALLLDAQSMEVKALVGSADYFDAAIDGQVNGAAARRSPGSTLKPFIYALALDQGILHPRSILRDAPTAFGPFSPENFDGRFVGPISAQEALVRSRNVPAVAVSAKLSRPSLYDFLRSAGVAKMASEAHYGLALALGGGELTMEELARLYAMLANGGVLRPLAWQPAAGPDHAERIRLVSEEAAFVTLDMLANNPRPDTGLPAVPAVAWKTGTSWGFRDAWTAGVFGRYVLVVWIGNFDGSGNPAFIGIRTAAPLFFRIVDALRAQQLDPAPPPRLPPARLAQVEVCTASGDLPNADCPDTVRTWFLPGKSPIRLSTLHRAVYIDTRTERPVCAPNGHTRREVYEFWPSELRRLFREAGMPRREPPPLPDCAAAAPDGDDPRIVAPLRGVTYTMRLSKPALIALRAELARQGEVFWFADQGFVGRTAPGEALAWNPPRPGRYVLRALAEGGGADSRAIDVEFAP